MARNTSTGKPKLPPKPPEEKPVLTLRFIPYYGIEIDQISGITPVGRTEEKAKQNLHAELRRRFPQGYILKWDKV